MATSPTTDPRVAAAIIPALEAMKNKIQKQHLEAVSQLRVWWRTSRFSEGVRTGDNLQVNGAAVSAGRVAGSADVFP